MTTVNRQRDTQFLQTIFLRVSQFYTWPAAFLFFHTIYKLRITGRENLKEVSNPFIIIANHVSITGSFLFRLVLGFLTPHLPLRFMAVRRFDLPSLNFLRIIGCVDFIYSLFGVFIIVPGRGLEKNLEEATRIIRSGGNVVIYPEGKLEVKNVIRPFKPGAAVLAHKTGAPALPVSFRLGKRIFLRKEMIVNIGKPVHVSPDATIEMITSTFQIAVEGLYGASH